MQFRSALVLGSMVMVLAACGGEDDRGTLDRPPVPMCGERPEDGDMRCDMPLDEAFSACTAAFPENDPRCVTKACTVAALACFRDAINAARECAACWGCGQSVRDRVCEAANFEQGRACAEAASTDDAAVACADEAFDRNITACGVEPGAGRGVWLVGCR